MYAVLISQDNRSPMARKHVDAKDEEEVRFPRGGHG